VTEDLANAQKFLVDPSMLTAIHCVISRSSEAYMGVDTTEAVVCVPDLQTSNMTLSIWCTPYALNISLVHTLKVHL